MSNDIVDLTKMDSSVDANVDDSIPFKLPTLEEIQIPSTLGASASDLSCPTLMQKENSNSDLSTDDMKTEKVDEVPSIQSDTAVIAAAQLASSTQGVQQVAAQNLSVPFNIPNIVQVGENSWMCNICKQVTFPTVMEACMHEMVCKTSHGANFGFAHSSQMAFQIPTLFSSPNLTGQVSSVQHTHTQSNSEKKRATRPKLPTRKSMDAKSAVGSNGTNALSFPLAADIISPSLVPMLPSNMGMLPNDLSAANDSHSTALLCQPVADSIQTNDVSLANKEKMLSENSIESNGTKETEAAVDGKGNNDVEMESPEAVRNERTNEEKEKDGVISMTTTNQEVLSDYNKILVENIEFFQVPVGYDVEGDMPPTKVGLRCVHCCNTGQHITAASFFPSSINSISSGIGTIGSRHFIGGKCTFIPRSTVSMLSNAKKISQQQTRTAKRIGLDGYCKEFAKNNGICNRSDGGIYCKGEKGLKNVESSVTLSNPEESTQKKKSASSKRKSSEVSSTTATTKSSVSSNESAPQKIDRNDPSAFVGGDIEYFWECKHCRVLPHQWRASGSVVFCASQPTMELVGKHLSACQGNKPLCIPRDASMKVKTSKSDTIGQEGEEKLSVVVQWESSGRKKTRTKRRHSISSKEGRAKKKLKKSSSNSTQPSIPPTNVKTGIEEEALVSQDSKSMTTDFVYLTIQQLRKCYLTKAGGSRGNCPVGYPGIACMHCSGTKSERRFFYTSSEHLRNSFSHIPTHVVNCAHCPQEIKDQLEQFKQIRNSQKLQLKAGDHKAFIEKVWTSLHGEGGGVVLSPDEDSDEDEQENEFVTSTIADIPTVCDDDSIASVEDEALNDDFVIEAIDGKHLDGRPYSSDISSSIILNGNDKRLTSNFCFLSLLQLMPKQIILEKDESNKVEEDVQGCGQEATVLQENFEGEATKQKSKDEISSKEPSDILGRSANEQSLLKECSEMSDTKAEELSLDVGKANDDVDEKLPSDTKEDTTTKLTTLVCKYCDEDFDLHSSECLRKAFPLIPNHLMSCDKCPKEVKEKLTSLKAFRPVQEALLPKGSHKRLMTNVWNRIERHFVEPNPNQSMLTEVYDFSDTELLVETDQTLCSEFTFYAMDQMVKTINDTNGGNRSMFPHGFAGLVCSHCNGTQNARKFFYRTGEILAGNYSHIPNHLLKCRHVPAEVKRTLSDKKTRHQQQKSRLGRGDQRNFFEKVFARLHQSG